MVLLTVRITSPDTSMNLIGVAIEMQADAAIRQIEGTARSMGIEVVG